MALSTSATTAMWISVGVMPTSVAFGFSPLLDCALAVADTVPHAHDMTVTQSATQRNRFRLPIPARGVRRQRRI